MSNRFLRWTLSGVILSLAAFLGYFFVGHLRGNVSPTPVESPVLQEADAGMKGFVYRQTKDGVVQWEVAARKAEVFEAKHEATLETVELKLFGHGGQEMILQADEGIINTVTNDFELRNREKLIAIELANGYTILTPHVYWIDSKQEIRTTDLVTIQGQGLQITGIGLVGYLESEEFTVLDQVRVESMS